MKQYKDCVYVATDGSWGDAEDITILNVNDLTPAQWDEVYDAPDGAEAILKFLKENNND